MPAPSLRRTAARGLLLYGLTALFLLASVAMHEYSHYAAREGPGVPAVRFHPGLESANDALVVQSPHGVALRGGEATIVFLPNTFRQALTLGLVPAATAQDGGVLAVSYLPGATPHEARQAGSAPWGSVEGAPVTVAAACLALSLAWVAWSRGIAARAALLASAVALGNTQHHMAELGVSAARMEAFTGASLALAAALALFAGETFRSFLRSRCGSASLRPPPAPSEAILHAGPGRP